MGFETLCLAAYSEKVKHQRRQVVHVPQGGISVTAVRKDPPDLERFVAALLSFALERRDQEQKRRQLPAINLLQKVRH